MECTVRAALRADALAEQREPAGSASASRWLRQYAASVSRWLRSLAPCMHSATLRQRFALAPRSSSPQSALRAACCDPRCLHTGPLNPRCVAALRAAAVTVTACGSSRAGVGPSSPVSTCVLILQFSDKLHRIIMQPGSRQGGGLPFRESAVQAGLAFHCICM